MEEVIDLSKIDEVVSSYGEEKGALIPILQKTQDIYSYLPKEALEKIAKKLKLPQSQVLGVASFYSQFYRERRGKNIIKICDGTACHVKGSMELIKTIKGELGILAGETTDDYNFTFELVYCLGCCALAPTVVVNNEIRRTITKDKLIKIINFLK